MGARRLSQGYEEAYRTWMLLEQLFDEESLAVFRRLSLVKADRFWEILLKYGQMHAHKLFEKGEYRKIKLDETKKLLALADGEHRKEWRESLLKKYRKI
ncbi:MAG: hypothetical protein ACE5GD_07900 [Candidatus Geothermarchaeales archaeon]